MNKSDIDTIEGHFSNKVAGDGMIQLIQEIVEKAKRGEISEIRTLIMLHKLRERVNKLYDEMKDYAIDSADNYNGQILDGREIKTKYTGDSYSWRNVKALEELKQRNLKVMESLRARGQDVEEWTDPETGEYYEFPKVTKGKKTIEIRKPR